jgi:hypothetical protein
VKGEVKENDFQPQIYKKQIKKNVGTWEAWYTKNIFDRFKKTVFD